MELQQIDSAETDTEMEKLTRQMFSFKIIKEREQNFSTLMGAETKHLIKVMDVFEITKRYLLNGFYSAMKKRRIVETIMSFRPSQSGKKNQQETMPYPWSRDPETLMPFLLSQSGNKDPQETLPENPEEASQTNRKITLQSSDREVFEVDKAVALQSLWIKCYIDCNCADYGITISEVTSKILSKVIEYCKKHVESRKSDDCATDAIDDDLKAWDAEFMKVDQATLFDLIHAAHYLDIKSLSKLTCKTLLDMTRGQTQEEFMRTFILLIHHV